MQISNLMLLAAMSVGLAAPAAAPTDEEAIRATALDYIEGWYAGDAARMERSLDPELAKRIFLRGPDGTTRLEQMSALTLINRTRDGRGRSDPHPRTDVRILDRFENMASVRVDASRWVDYLHMAKVEGRWRIINVLWELRPGATR